MYLWRKRIKIKEDIFDRINGTTSTKNTPSNLQGNIEDLSTKICIFLSSQFITKVQRI